MIVSGGTMEPISEFKDQLFNFNGDNSDRIMHFSCGHVVPPDHILPLIVCSGPTGKQFDFSYQERTSIKMVQLYFVIIIKFDLFNLVLFKVKICYSLTKLVHY